MNLFSYNLYLDLAKKVRIRLPTNHEKYFVTFYMKMQNFILLKIIFVKTYYFTLYGKKIVTFFQIFRQKRVNKAPLREKFFFNGNNTF
jgi:DNA-dependent RNA polymerase auxiliary subunit epsilon